MKSELRVLSIRQPWAHLIVSGIKRVENRTWSTRYRGLVLIHAALRPAETPVEEIEKKFGITIGRDLARGGIVGIAGLAGVIYASADPFFEGPYGLVMVAGRRLLFLPSKGALGLRSADPAILGRIDPSLVQEVWSAIKAVS